MKDKISNSHTFIPYGRQSIDEEGLASVVNVLRSDWLTTGPLISKFEEALANYCGAKFAVVCSSGTAALHLTQMALGTGQQDIE